jgi:dipeptidyl aminopeptidase/acylaminoacyl peptidase
MVKPIIILAHSILQTERYFQALKGLGAPTRMVILPKEAHSYVAKENILHLYGNKISFRKIFENLVEKAPN